MSRELDIFLAETAQTKLNTKVARLTVLKVALALGETLRRV